MFELAAGAVKALGQAYQEKALFDFLTGHFPLAACMIGAVLILAVILPIGPEWFRATKIAGMGIMSGGLILMVGGFLWAGAIAMTDAVQKTRKPSPRIESGSQTMPVFPQRDPAKDFNGG